MNQRYNGNTKRPRLKENQHFKNLSMRIHAKNCCIFPVKVMATLLNDSRKNIVAT